MLLQSRYTSLQLKCENTNVISKVQHEHKALYNTKLFALTEYFVLQA